MSSPAVLLVLAAFGLAAVTPTAPAGDAAATLAAARAAYSALEFEQVLGLAEQALATEGVTVDQRMDAYFLQGSALAVVGRDLDAATAFRYLLRGRPDFEVSENTPPKIVAVFRRVQAEERAIREQVAELERKRVVESLKVQGDPPAKAQGGVPVVFVYSISDPTQAVGAVRVQYRRAGAGDYSSLALERGDTGEWHGQIPGEWTENDDGFDLEYFTITYDAAGEPLLSLGTEQTPHQINVAPGSVADSGPFYAQPWFWAVSGGAALVVAAAVGAIVVVATLPPGSGLPVNRLD